MDRKEFKHFKGFLCVCACLGVVFYLYFNLQSWTRITNVDSHITVVK